MKKDYFDTKGADMSKTTHLKHEGPCIGLKANITLESLRNSTKIAITRKEAAAALGVDPRTITVGILQGTIPSVALGRRRIIPREKFLRIFE